jgi:hypothetical protein
VLVVQGYEMVEPEASEAAHLLYVSWARKVDKHRAMLDRLEELQLNGDQQDWLNEVLGASGLHRGTVR